MKQQRKIVLGAILMAICVGLSLSTLAWSDDDEHDEHRGEMHEMGEGGFLSHTSDVPVITNTAYKNECAACHFAYPPGLLPERSWVKIMTSLDDHFGEDAELDQATRDAITTYLRGHAADRLPNRFSRSVLRSIDRSATPMRITETGYFRHKHREVPDRMVTGNKKVRSFSNCLACHRTANQGVFDEERVHIPGYGFWED